MNIEGSNISCGVRRLTIGANEKPSKEELSKLIDQYKRSCAILMTGVPNRRRDVIGFLLSNDFEQIKNPIQSKQFVLDNASINPAFIDMAALIMDRETPGIDAASMFEEFVEKTVNTDLTNMAGLILHHCNELIGNLSFFIRYMQ